MSVLFRIAGVCVLLASSTGCECARDCSLTHKLWTSHTFECRHVPAVNPELRLFEGTQRGDLLVRYDELITSKDDIQPRAYWLYENSQRVNRGSKPHFVPLATADGLQAIPVNPAGETQARHAVIAPKGESFTLHEPGRIPHEHPLPTYRDTPARIQRWVLTPFAIAVDAVQVGLVVGTAGVLAIAYSGPGQL